MTPEPLSDYARFKREVSVAQRDELAFARWKEQQPEPKCATCGGSGWLGGPSYYDPGEGGEPCPDCAPA